jgi:hypothetical protein
MEVISVQLLTLCRLRRTDEEMSVSNLITLLTLCRLRRTDEEMSVDNPLHYQRNCVIYLSYVEMNLITLSTILTLLMLRRTDEEKCGRHLSTLLT